MAGGNSRERTALIVTVLDEVSTIDRLLESIERQTRQPDEIVVVDGGSHDRTWDRLQAWRPRLGSLRPLRAPGATIAAGRNVRYVELGGDDHWLSSASTRTQMLQEIEGFLAQSLKK